MINEDTICAVATAQGGAIGIVRVSGPEAVAITAAIFTPATAGIRWEERSPYTLTLGTLHDGKEVVDEVLVSLFRAPRSYTGEDSTEIACHGSRYILQKVLQLLVDHGCRLARPGEYTQRAFLNGKMDLSQAEAVADLIASTSAATHRLAMNQMRGGFQRELTALHDRLLHFTSLIELELDFSDHEELEFADRAELHRLADEIEGAIVRLTDSFSVGNALKNGVPVAIVGETNVGKSTLLNLLLNEERAIVSDIHGTTRDTIEDTAVIGGTTFRFIDTAGIRDTHDTIESLGIGRTFQKIDQAEIVLWLVDITGAVDITGSANKTGSVDKTSSIDKTGSVDKTSSIDATGTPSLITDLAKQVLPHCIGKQLILVLNKSDLTAESNNIQKVASEVLNVLCKMKGAKEVQGMRSVAISAKHRTNIPALLQLLTDAAHLPTVTQNDIIVTNARHYEALTHALDAIRRVQTGLDNHLSGDFLAQDIRECIFYLSEITGTITTDAILQSIFEHFCVGK